MKKLMALALAGASMLACGQAQAAVTFSAQMQGILSGCIADISAVGGCREATNDLFNMSASGGAREAGDTSPFYTASIFGSSLVINSYQQNTYSITLGLDRPYSPDDTGTYLITGGTVFAQKFREFNLQGSISSGFVTFGPSLPSVPAYSSFNAAMDVPEPATWAMMIAGFGIVGAGLRRRHAFISAESAAMLSHM